jgi:hydrogenase maturation protease
MTQLHPGSIIVLGLGNLLKSDDGIGIHAIQHLQKDPRTPSVVRLVDGGTLGLELLQYAWCCSHLLVLDAVDFGAAPGAIVTLNSEDLGHLKGGATVHDLGFSDLLAAMKLVGAEPPVLKLIGVQPETTALGTDLSKPVALALPHLVNEALAQVEEWLEEMSAEAALRTAVVPKDKEELVVGEAPVLAKPA